MIIDGHAHIGTASKFYAFKVRTVEKTIEAMNRSIELLGPENDGELKGMTLSEIKSIAVTYLKSIKELPAKLKR